METIIRAAVLYCLLLLVLRFIPRRAGNNMTRFEFILMFIIGGMAIQMVVADDRSLLNAALAVVTVGLMHTLVVTLKQRFESFGKWPDGTPIPVFEDGQWHEERMNQFRVQEQDVMAPARQQNVRSVDEIWYAIAERNGSVSIIKRSDDEQLPDEEKREDDEEEERKAS